MQWLVCNITFYKLHAERDEDKVVLEKCDASPAVVIKEACLSVIVLCVNTGLQCLLITGIPFLFPGFM